MTLKIAPLRAAIIRPLPEYPSGELGREKKIQTPPASNLHLLQNPGDNMARPNQYSRAYAVPYPGGNDTIDRLHDDKTDIWIVNGIKGRRVMLLPIGTTAAEAKDAYDSKYGLAYYTPEDIEHAEAI